MRADDHLTRGRRDPSVIVASFGANLLALAVPMAMLHIYDRVIPNQAYETLLALGVIVFLAIFAELALRAARRYLLELTGDKFERQAYSQAVEALLLADPARGEKASPGHYYRCISGVETLRNMHAGNAALDPLDLPFALLFLGVIAMLSPVMGATILSLLATSFLALRLSRRVVLKHQMRRKENEERRHSFLAELLRGIDVIKNMRIEDFMLRRYERLMGHAATVGADISYAVQMSQGVTAAIGVLSPLFVGSIGAIMVIEGQITIGSLAAIVLLTGRIVQPMLRIEAFLAGAENRSQYQDDLQHVLDMPARPDGDMALSSIEALDFLDVDFAPDPVLEIGFSGLNLSLNKGDCIEITGATRDARRLFLRALLGELAMVQGAVHLNGRPQEGYALADRQRLIKMLSPDHTLIEGTLLENLTAFQPSLYRDKAIELSQRIGIEQTISQSPEGFGMVVGPDARAVLPKALSDAITIVSDLVCAPDVILFDEANGTLDRDTDARLLEILGGMRGDCIIILVTNRPSYAKLANSQLDISEYVRTEVSEDAA